MDHHAGNIHCISLQYIDFPFLFEPMGEFSDEFPDSEIQALTAIARKQKMPILLSDVPGIHVRTVLWDQQAKAAAGKRAKRLAKSRARNKDWKEMSDKASRIEKRNAKREARERTKVKMIAHEEAKEIGKNQVDMQEERARRIAELKAQNVEWERKKEMKIAKVEAKERAKMEERERYQQAEKEQAKRAADARVKEKAEQRAKAEAEEMAQMEAAKKAADARAEEEAESRRAKIHDIWNKALKAAFESKTEVAWNHCENGLLVCNKTSGTCLKEEINFQGLLAAISRVVSRREDPREWSVQEVADYLRIATGDMSLSPQHTSPLDGHCFVTERKFFLVLWTGGRSKDLLEKIFADIDNIIFDADLIRGELKDFAGRIIKHSEVILEDRPFASGGFADVYGGNWRGKSIVLKTFKGLSVNQSTKSTLDALVREVEAMRNCSASEFIVKSHGIMLGRVCGIVMERLVCSLQELIESNELGDLRNRMRILLDTARGMQSIHEAGRCHGDIKPSNLLKSRQGRIKISDFGMSKHITALESHTCQKAQSTAPILRVGGTLQYMAPEVWRHGRHTTGDIWSFGLVVWHMISCLSTPWPDFNEHQIMCKVLLDKEIPRITESALLEFPRELIKLYVDCCSHDPSNRPTASDIVRRMEDLLEANDVPVHWAPFNPGLDKYSLQMFELRAGSDEHASVVERFTKSCKNFSVVRLQRIQNLEQWNLYSEKKQAMEVRNRDLGGSNEKLLFHGTSPDTVPLINKKSFNRSYCGKNGTHYGQGVYFARDASYSAQHGYSVPDGQGLKYLYLVRVLVGATTLGQLGMKEPPLMPCGIRSFDTTFGGNDTDPQIVVVYHDAQAYPEYLLTVAHTI